MSPSRELSLLWGRSFTFWLRPWRELRNIVVEHVSRTHEATGPNVSRVEKRVHLAAVSHRRLPLYGTPRFWQFSGRTGNLPHSNDPLFGPALLNSELPTIPAGHSVRRSSDRTVVGEADLCQCPGVPPLLLYGRWAIIPPCQLGPHAVGSHDCQIGQTALAATHCEGDHGSRHPPTRCDQGSTQSSAARSPR